MTLTPAIVNNVNYLKGGETMEHLVTISQAARDLTVSRTRIYQMAEAKKLTVVTLGGRLFLVRDDKYFHEMTKRRNNHENRP